MVQRQHVKDFRMFGYSPKVAPRFAFARVIEDVQSVDVVVNSFQLCAYRGLVLSGVRDYLHQRVGISCGLLHLDGLLYDVVKGLVICLARVAVSKLLYCYACLVDLDWPRLHDGENIRPQT